MPLPLSDGRTMNLHRPIFAACASLALLVACGGGAAVISLNWFAGSWVNNFCEPDGGGGSSTFSLRLTQINDGYVSGVVTIRNYTDAGCAGVPTTTTLSLLQDGTKPVNDDTTIRVVIGTGSSRRNDIFLVKDGQLFGGNASLIGSDGFPDALDFSRPFNHP
jgi:hypothetical protein